VTQVVPGAVQPGFSSATYLAYAGRDDWWQHRMWIRGVTRRELGVPAPFLGEYMNPEP
jgi:hypothetical protein